MSRLGTDPVIEALNAALEAVKRRQGSLMRSMVVQLIEQALHYYSKL